MCFFCNHNFEIIHKVAMHKTRKRLGVGKLGTILIGTMEVTETEEIPDDVMLIAFCKKCGKTIRITAKKGRID